MSMSSIMRLVHLVAIPATLVATSPQAQAQGFALAASPPRLELTAKAGETTRANFELNNVAPTPTPYAFATADWELAADGGVAFNRALAPDSCRPWVAIERSEATIPGNGVMRYRFEVTPPAGTPARECRFAILVSGTQSNTIRSQGINLGFSGQVAIIVYVAIGDAKPDIHIVKADVATVNGEMLPVLMVENAGKAHGRLSALLSGIDARNRKRDFAISTLPILPGEKRMIVINIDQGGDDIIGPASRAKPKPDAIAWPLKMSGMISDTVQSFRFDAVFGP